MAVSQLSFLVALVLIGFAHGAPSQTVSRQSDCTAAMYVQDNLKCLNETIDFSNEIKALTEAKDMDEKAKFAAMRQTCVPVRECFTTTQCLIEPFLTLKSTCNAMSYFSSPNYLLCQIRIDMTSHNCKQGDECDLFGVDNCEKDLYTKVCGHKEWVKYRDVTLKIARLVDYTDTCSISGLESL